MSKVTSHKIILYTFTSLAITLLVVAMVSLFFSSKTLDIKQQELQLEQKMKQLKIKIAQKQDYYQKIKENIQEMQELVGLKKESKNEDIETILKKCTPVIKKLILTSLPTGYPSKSRRITSVFGYRMHPIYHQRRFHHGIDFGGKLGLPIKATADGIVEFSGYTEGGYGNLVIIDHDFGFKTLYGHMLKNLQVKKGDFVTKGEVIGYLGNTGLSTGPHLHYEIKYIRNILNPASFLVANEKHFKKLLQEENRIAWQPLIHAITNRYRHYVALQN